MTTSGKYYILGDDHEVIRVDDVLTWDQWMHDHQKDIQVANDIIGERYEVSTVFFGLNMGFGDIAALWLHPDLPAPPPLLFETCVFTLAPGFRSSEPMVGEDFWAYVQLIRTDMLDGVGGRWCTWAEARAEHQRVVKGLEASLNG